MIVELPRPLEKIHTIIQIAKITTQRAALRLDGDEWRSVETTSTNSREALESGLLIEFSIASNFNYLFRHLTFFDHQFFSMKPMIRCPISKVKKKKWWLWGGLRGCFKCSWRSNILCVCKIAQRGSINWKLQLNIKSQLWWDQKTFNPTQGLITTVAKTILLNRVIFKVNSSIVFRLTLLLLEPNKYKIYVLVRSSGVTRNIDTPEFFIVNAPRPSRTLFHNQSSFFLASLADVVDVNLRVKWHYWRPFRIKQKIT